MLNTLNICWLISSLGYQTECPISAIPLGNISVFGELMALSKNFKNSRLRGAQPSRCSSQKYYGTLLTARIFCWLLCYSLKLLFILVFFVPLFQEQITNVFGCGLSAFSRFLLNPGKQVFWNRECRGGLTRLSLICHGLI